MKRFLLALLVATTISTPALADLALATSKNCMTCHSVDRKVIGPAFKDVAAKYAGQPGMVDVLAAKIMHGGGGVCDDFPLAWMYAHLRTLRLADGPDEVHKLSIARRELAPYVSQGD